MSKKQEKQFEQKPKTETHSVSLGALVQHYIKASGLPCADDWQIFAVDPPRDTIVLIREVKTE